MFPSPLVGEGRVGGREATNGTGWMHVRPSSPARRLSTPTPNPSPQGGGEHAANFAALCIDARGSRFMKPRPFDYVRPDTVEEVLALLAEYGDDARILAGGQSLLSMLNLRLADPAVLIDISRIGQLDVISDLGDAVEVRAAVAQNKLMAWPLLRRKLPLVAAALPFVGHFQTRNKGTVCGSIAHADPSAELPLALAVLGGDVMLRSQKRGSRAVAAGEFFVDMLTTLRARDELVAAVRFPVIEGKGTAFREVARRHGDFAIVAVAAIADARGAAQVGVGGMAGRPAVRGVGAGGAAAMAETIAQWAEELEGYEDLHASAAMRRDIFKNLAPRVIEEARRCAA